MRFSTTLLSFAGLIAFTQAASVQKRVNAPAPCSQSGTGKFGTFSVSPKKVVRNQPITITYQQDCAEEGDVYPTEMVLTINQEHGSPQQFVASLGIPEQEYGQQITLDTAVPNAPLPFGNGTDIVFAGNIKYTTKEYPDVTYIYTFEEGFEIDESAPPYQGESK